MQFISFSPWSQHIGLYRYRVGDVLQVVGFYNNAPQVRFICRRNVVISVDTEKTNEEDLHRGVTMAKKLLEPYDSLLVEYTSYPDTSSVPGHYVLYWEILHCGIKTESSPQLQLDANVLEECCIAVEEQLDYVYRRCRSYDKSVGPLEIRVVEPGTFDALMDLFISQGASINQYKTPRCIKSKKALKLLKSKVTASFFSPRDPKWAPKMCSSWGLCIWSWIASKLKSSLVVVKEFRFLIHWFVLIIFSVSKSRHSFKAGTPRNFITYISASI